MKLTANIIDNHKILIEDTYNTKVLVNQWHLDKIIDRSKSLEALNHLSGWLVFSDDTYIYKSFYQNNNDAKRILDYQRKFFQYHRSNLIIDYKKFPPYGLIIKQRKIPGVSLNQCTEKLDPTLFVDWFIDEVIHIHEIGVRLSKEDYCFTAPFNTPLTLPGYDFVFGDMSLGNIMYDKESKEFNFIDFEPLGWVPHNIAFCLLNLRLTVVLEKITGNIGSFDFIEEMINMFEEQFKKRIKSVSRNDVTSKRVRWVKRKEC